MYVRSQPYHYTSTTLYFLQVKYTAFWVCMKTEMAGQNDNMEVNFITLKCFSKVHAMS